MNTYGVQIMAAMETSREWRETFEGKRPRESQAQERGIGNLTRPELKSDA